MNENFITNMKSNLQPMVDVAEISRKAFEELASLQSNCMTDCLNASLEQLKTLAEAQDPQAVTELQIQFFKDMEIKLAEAAEQEVAAFSEAQEAISDVVQKSANRVAGLSFFKSDSDLEASVTSTTPMAVENRAVTAVEKQARVRKAPVSKSAASPPSKSKAS